MGMIRPRDTLTRWLDTKVKHDGSGPRKWNYEDLAEAIKVSPSLIAKVMSGHRNVTTNLVMKLCHFTNYDLGEIFYYDRDAEPKESGDEKDD